MSRTIELMVALLLVVCVFIFITIYQNEQIIELQTDLKEMKKDIVDLESKVHLYPIDHTRIESNVNLIGRQLFPNWDMASKLYAMKGGG